MHLQGARREQIKQVNTHAGICGRLSQMVAATSEACGASQACGKGATLRPLLTWARLMSHTAPLMIMYEHTPAITPGGLQEGEGGHVVGGICAIE